LDDFHDSHVSQELAPHAHHINHKNHSADNLPTVSTVIFVIWMIFMIHTYLKSWRLMPFTSITKITVLTISQAGFWERTPYKAQTQTASRSNLTNPDGKSGLVRQPWDPTTKWLNVGGVRILGIYTGFVLAVQSLPWRFHSLKE
jgi:hypothetical protein